MPKQAGTASLNGSAAVAAPGSTRADAGGPTVQPLQPSAAEVGRRKSSLHQDPSSRLTIHLASTAPLSLPTYALMIGPRSICRCLCRRHFHCALLHRHRRSLWQRASRARSRRCRRCARADRAGRPAPAASQSRRAQACTTRCPTCCAWNVAATRPSAAPATISPSCCAATATSALSPLLSSERAFLQTSLSPAFLSAP